MRFLSVVTTTFALGLSVSPALSAQMTNPSLSDELTRVDSPASRLWIKGQSDSGSQFLQQLRNRADVARVVGQYQYPRRINIPRVLADGRIWAVTLGGSGTELSEVDSTGAPLRTIVAGVLPTGWVPDESGQHVAILARATPAALWRLVRVRDRAVTDSIVTLDALSGRMVWDDSGGVYYVSVTREVLYRSKSGDERKIPTDLGGDPKLALTEGSQYLVVERGFINSSRREVSVVDLAVPFSSARAVVTEIRTPGTRLFVQTSFAGDYAGELYFVTTSKAALGRIIALNPRTHAIRTVVAEGRRNIMSAQLIGGTLLVTYSEGALPRPSVYDLQGRFLREMPLPEIGTTWDQMRLVPGYRGHRSQTMVFFSLLTARRPPGVFYRAHVTKGTASPVTATPALAFDPDSYVVSHTYFQSRDGVRIPIFLAHAKSFKRDGLAAAIVDAVPAAGTTALSFWSPSPFTIMAAGGVYAFIGARGGEDGGIPWRAAGAGPRREKSVNDYVDGVRWLVRQRYAKLGRVAAVSAGAHSTVLAGAINQAPELFRVVAMGAGVYDLARMHQYPGGDLWDEEFGGRDLARVRQRWSPLQHLPGGRCLPAMLLSTGDRDSVAFSAHTYLYAREVRTRSTCARPVILEVLAGQGYVTTGASPLSQIAFFMDQLELPVPVRR